MVLIGGSSSVGKTTLARELARRIDGEHLQVDDLRRTVDDPRVHFLSQTAYPWRLDPPSLCLVLQRAAEAMRPVVGRAVDAALAGGRRLVLEGEGLDPGLAARYESDLRVSALFVVERDSERLAQTLHARSPSFRRLSAAEQETVARTAVLYRWRDSGTLREVLQHLKDLWVIVVAHWTDRRFAGTGVEIGNHVATSVVDVGMDNAGFGTRLMSPWPPPERPHPLLARPTGLNRAETRDQRP